MDESTDSRWSQLMAAAQKGNKTEYGQLLREIMPVLKRYFVQKLGLWNLHEDALQETMLAIHKVRHTYDSERSFAKWMYAIARYKMIDAIRKHKKHLSVPLPNDMDGIEAPHTGIEEKDLLRKGLSSLPEGQKEAVEMLKIDGLSVAEAAKKAGISEGALRVRAHRGYENLKKNLLRESNGI